MTDQQLLGYREHAESFLSSYIREFSTNNIADPGQSLPVQEHELTVRTQIAWFKSPKVMKSSENNCKFPHTSNDLQEAEAGRCKAITMVILLW